MTNFRPTILKELADDNFEADDNGGKFSERVENAVEKGEIARYEQFLPFPQSFQKAFQKARGNQCLLGKGLNV